MELSEDLKVSKSRRLRKKPSSFSEEYDFPGINPLPIDQVYTIIRGAKRAKMPIITKGMNYLVIAFWEFIAI
jgi:hypothetical protein